MPESATKGQTRSSKWGVCSSETPTISSATDADPTPSAKNIKEAKSLLQQRALLTANDIILATSLANTLFKISWEDKIPEQVVASIRAVGLLVVSKLNDDFSMGLAALISDKLNGVFQLFTSAMTQEQNYFKASIVEQASYTLKLVEATNNTCPLLQKIDGVLSGFSQALL